MDYCEIDRHVRSGNFDSWQVRLYPGPRKERQGYGTLLLTINAPCRCSAERQALRLMRQYKRQSCEVGPG
jgi:hypothetical protein